MTAFRAVKYSRGYEKLVDTLHALDYGGGIGDLMVNIAGHRVPSGCSISCHFPMAERHEICLCRAQPYMHRDPQVQACTSIPTPRSAWSADSHFFLGLTGPRLPDGRHFCSVPEMWRQ